MVATDATLSESSAGFVIFRNEGNHRLYLLLHHSVGHWDYAKGHIEPGENEEQAARREAKEETGITDLRILEGFKEKITYHFKRAGKFITKSVVFYAAETAQDRIILSSEHTAFKWLAYPAAIKQITYDSSKELLGKAEKFISEYGKQSRLSFYYSKSL